MLQFPVFVIAYISGCLLWVCFVSVLDQHLFRVERIRDCIALGLTSLPLFCFLFFCFPKIYFIMVVYSYINALREDPSGTSAGFSPSLPGGNKTPDDNYISIVVMLHDFRSQIHYEYFCVTEQKNKGGRSSTRTIEIFF